MTVTRRHFLKASAALPLLARPADAANEGRRIRIAQIGTQHGHAAGKMETLRRLNAHFEVVGLASADPSAGAGTVFDGIRRMDIAGLLAVPDLEAVVVETDFADAC